MPIRNIPERESQMMDSLVSSGRYKCTEDVIAAAFDLLFDFESEYHAKLEALRAAVDEGIADFENGNYVEFDSPQALSDYIHQMAERIDAERQAR